jgi:hypothetical protein
MSNWIRMMLIGLFFGFAAWFWLPLAFVLTGIGFAGLAIKIESHEE